MGADVWAIIAVLFFWLWAASFLMAIFHACPARGELRSVPAMIWGTIVLMSGGLWVVGLLKAA